ncbi:MAG: 16S rRNA (guanine(966)-N(2))-methyltransferase RsmD [Candidatus Izemoplasma sp.]|nr:16S rRNA (guanine(966)-N(2))-methyltransferase RsmD [Candidatus Izemoplasma sp.]
MRVISGKYRSRKLERVDSNKTRETKDRVKESLFNAIHFDVVDATVLDLFAGSGALGIEALSREAKHCDFIDQSNQAVTVIQRNIKALDIASKCQVFQSNYEAFLKECHKRYDIILLDPPYKTYDLDQLIDMIETEKRLEPYGLIVVLMHKSEVLNRHKHGIIDYKTKIKGITKIVFLKWSD